MKQKLQISEFAKLRQVTTETLRHYDRVDLLKPIEVDEETGYRYYSPFQSERLSTILDLKVLGFSIDEMKAYFANRDIHKSHRMLKEKHIELRQKINDLQRVESIIAKKIDHLEDMMALNDDHGFVIKLVPEQFIAYMDKTIEGEESFEFIASDMESKLKAMSPVIGSDAYGVVINKEAMLKGHPFEGAHLIYKIEHESDIDAEYIKILPQRQVACFNIRGVLPDHGDHLKNMLKSIQESGYEVGEEIIVYYRIDASVTDVGDEMIREYQVPVYQT